jgi:hypothetical protein
MFEIIRMRYKSKLLFVEWTINSNQYVENLAELGFVERFDLLYRLLSWIFQQDIAPYHRLQQAFDWIVQNCNILFHWPTNSLDINPIKLFLTILKHSLVALCLEMMDELKEILLQTSDMISTKTIENLCRSFATSVNPYLEIERHWLANNFISISRLMQIKHKGHAFKSSNHGWTKNIRSYLHNSTYSGGDWNR